MIERPLLERALSRPAEDDAYEFWVSGSVMRELCRVYLAWLDAPETKLTMVGLCDPKHNDGMLFIGQRSLLPDAFKSMGDKLVRLVEVKDE